MFELKQPTTVLRKRRRPLLVTHNGQRVEPHIPVAEKALGHKLPKGAEVHHVDNDPYNNDPENLVICPDAAYHKLLHQRQRAFDACGHFDWRKCQHCGQYDDPARMWTSRKKAAHRHCSAVARCVARWDQNGVPIRVLKPRSKPLEN